MAESWGSMADYVKRALFVYGEDRKELVERVGENRYGVDIAALPVANFLAEPALHLPGVAHVVVAAALPQVKAVVLLAETHGLSVGFLAPKGQKVLRDAYELPVDQPAQIELALRDGAPPVDLATCNGEVVMLRGVVGRLPLVDAALHRSRTQILLQGLRGLFGLKLRELRVETAGGRTIRTAACGCTLVQRFDRMRASRFLVRSNSLTDGMISLLIVAPMSVLNYLQSLMSLLIGKSDHARMPPTMGFMRSSSLKISGAAPFSVVLDGVRSELTALTCVVRPKAVRLNIGGAVLTGGDDPKELDELVEIANLPAGKELAKAKDGTIPFFSYASEERFRDLFTALHEDARISGTYLILMVLSALLATHFADLVAARPLVDRLPPGAMRLQGQAFVNGPGTSLPDNLRGWKGYFRLHAAVHFQLGELERLHRQVLQLDLDLKRSPASPLMLFSRLLQSACIPGAVS